MQGIASFIMRGSLQASLVAVVSMILSAMMPLLSCLSGGTVALVALRRGWRDALNVILISGLGIMAVAWFGSRQFGPTLLFVSAVWLPAVSLALVLRRTISLAYAIYTAAGLGVVIIIGTYIVLGDPAEAWKVNVIEPVIAMLANLKTDAQTIQEQTEVMLALAPFMTGAVAGAVAFSALMSLFVGRWWQAILYNPGGFRQEFHGLQLGRRFALGTIAVIVVSMVPLGQVTSMAREMAMLLISIIGLQGVALVHAIVAARNAHVAWLVAMYCFMVVVPQVLALLAMLALADMWFDLRGRLRGGGTGSGPPDVTDN